MCGEGRQSEQTEPEQSLPATLTPLVMVDFFPAAFLVLCVSVLAQGLPLSPCYPLW